MAKPKEHLIPMGDGVQLHAWVFRIPKALRPAAAIAIALRPQLPGPAADAERFAEAGFHH